MAAIHRGNCLGRAEEDLGIYLGLEGSDDIQAFNNTGWQIVFAKNTLQIVQRSTLQTRSFGSRSERESHI